MKNRSIFCLIGLFILSFGFTAKAQTSFIQEIPQILEHPRSFLLAHPEVMNQQLTFVISERCKYYVKQGSEQCHNAAHQLMQDLHIQPIPLEDPDTHEKASYIVTFTDELKALHADPRTLFFLQELDHDLDQIENDLKIYKFIAPQNIKPLEIGRLAMKYYGSFPTSLGALAALFQDLPQSEIQVRYLHQQFGDSATVMLLRKIITRLPRLTLQNGRMPITVFGQVAYNEKLYHMVVPAYLATRLFARHYPLQVAFFTAFAFNYIYEASETAGNFKTYFTEPKSLSDKESQNDIRSGEFGALLGISQTQRFIGEDQARKLLTQSPTLYIQTLMQNFDK